MVNEFDEWNGRPIPIIYKNDADPDTRTILMALERGLQLNTSTLKGSEMQYDKETSEILDEEDDGSKPARYMKVDLKHSDRTRSYRGTMVEPSNNQVQYLLRERTIMNDITGTPDIVYEMTRVDEYYRLTPLNPFSSLSFEETMKHYGDRLKRLNNFRIKNKNELDSDGESTEKEETKNKSEVTTKLDNGDLDAKVLDNPLSSHIENVRKKYEDLDDIKSDNKSEPGNETNRNFEAPEQDELSCFSADSQSKMHETDEVSDKQEKDSLAKINFYIYRLEHGGFLDDDVETDDEVKNLMLKGNAKKQKKKKQMNNGMESVF